MKNILFYNEFLNESLKGNKFYFETKDNDLENIYSTIRIGSYEYNIKLYEVYKDVLSQYKKSKSKLVSYTSNYIFQVSKPLNLFCFDKYHLKKLAENSSWLSTIKNYLSVKSDDLNDIINAFDKVSNKFELIRFENDEEYIQFSNMYDGITFDNRYFVFEKIIKSSKLIGGNHHIGINRDINKDIKIDEYVIDELIRYTDDASVKMNKNIKEELKKLNIKSEDNIVLYRGFCLELDDYGDFKLMKDEKALSKYLYRLTGVKTIEELKKGNYLNIKRGKESSWSHTPVIAKQFTKGLASGSINILVKYEAKPEDVIIDFTYLPKDIKKLFKFKYQNEVILETGSYKSKIVEIWYDDKFKKYLSSNI